MNTAIDNAPEVAEISSTVATDDNGAVKATRRRATKSKEVPDDQHTTSGSSADGETLPPTNNNGDVVQAAAEILHGYEQAANESHPVALSGDAEAVSTPGEIQIPEEQRLAIAQLKLRAEQREARRRQAVATVNRRARARALRQEGEQALAKDFDRIDGARLDRTVSFYSTPVLNVCKVDLRDVMQHTLFLTRVLPSLIGEEPAKVYVDRTLKIISTFKAYAEARNTGLQVVWNAHMQEASKTTYRDSSKPTEQMVIPVTCSSVMDILDAVEALDSAARYARLLEVVCKMTTDEYSNEVMGVKKHARRAFTAIANQNILARRILGQADRDSRNGEFEGEAIGPGDQGSARHERRRDVGEEATSHSEVSSAAVGSAALVAA